MVARVGGARVSLNAGYLVAVSVNILFAALLLGGGARRAVAAARLEHAGTLAVRARGILLDVPRAAGSCTKSVARLGPRRTSAFQVSSPLFTFLIALAFLGET
jgi:hypothetical protein